jgi:hypothetical protein
MEQDGDAIVLGGIDQDAVASALHHKHVPLLEEHGVVDYDRDQQTLTLADPPAKLLDFVDHARYTDGR